MLGEGFWRWWAKDLEQSVHFARMAVRVPRVVHTLTIVLRAGRDPYRVMAQRHREPHRPNRLGYPVRALG